MVLIGDAFPKLVFEGEFGEREIFEAKSRGYRSDVEVLLSEGKKYPVFFYDCTRLRQDLEAEMENGIAFVAEVGMIVVPEVTIENMTAAVAALVRQGYFNAFRSV